MKTDQSKKKKILLILGMHRSGTSLLARICNILGADLGQDLMQPGNDNPAGFWEHNKIVNIHEDILAALGLTWSDPLALPADWLTSHQIQQYKHRLIDLLYDEFSDSNLPCVKDPRLCRLLPLWKQVLIQLNWEPCYLVCFRNPVEVERSLQIRNNFRPYRSYLLWLRYVLEAEQSTRGSNRTFVSYQQVLQDWYLELNRAWRRLGLEWPGNNKFPEKEINLFIQPKLRHHTSTLNDLKSDHYLSVVVASTYEAHLHATDTTFENNESSFSRLQQHFQAYLVLFDPLLEEMRQHKIESENKVEVLGKEIINIKRNLADYEQRKEQLKEQVCSYREEVAQLKGEVNRARGIAEARDGEIRQLGNTVRQQSIRIESLQKENHYMSQSISWNITWPLRFLNRIARVLIQGHVKTYFRYVTRAYHILKQDGAVSLVRKVHDRLTKPTQKPTQKFELLPIPDEYGILSFQQYDQPTVSIIIPVYNKFDYTYRCLFALHSHASEHTFELIVVNDASTDQTREQLERFRGLRLVNNETNLGFVMSCNRGAKLSHAEYLVFLNNDTQVQSGWLDALIETFSIRTDAGLVGSRLLYPDGRLQEAGGIVWSDGSAWNYGHLSDPLEPRYNYLRAVDYCSAASIALTRVLFEKLGGFDEHFAPAYYEDTDLAFRVRKAGYQVYYQPTSTLIHFEGISAGKDPADQTSMKKFQEINQKKFVTRWASILQHHRNNGIEPELEKERRVAKRILVCDAYMLIPDRESGSLRMFNLLTILTQLGYKVTFAPLNLESREPYLSNLQKRGIECLYAPYIRSVASHIRKCGKLYNTIILSRADIARELMDIARFGCPTAQIVFDTVDLHYLREMREAQIKQDETLILMAKQRKKQEIALMRKADLTLVVSPFEKKTITQEFSGVDIHVLSNIHEIYGSERSFSERSDIMFIGGFNHPPNADAVLYFINDIFQKILARTPQIKFYVIGDNPPQSILSLENESIKVTGHIKDISSFLSRCRISVAPLRYGAGVKGKINTSLSYGVPVVGTKIATEGMYLTDNESVLVADKPEDFADAVVKLYSDESLWNKISAGGLSVMRSHFSFDAASNALRDILE